MGFGTDCSDRMESSLADVGTNVSRPPQGRPANFGTAGFAGGMRGLPVSLPSGDGRLANTAVRRFSEERGRYQE